jgi:WD40 repeat protein
VALYAAETGELTLEIGDSDGTGGSNPGAFSPDGRFFGRGETGGRFVTYELPVQPPFRARSIREWVMPRKSRLRSVAWSPDGNAVTITSNDQYISVCDAETGHVRWETQAGPGPSWAVVWNGPLQLIAAQANSDMIQTYHSSDGSQALQIHTPNDPSASAAFSSDGLLLASSTERFGIRLFNTFTGQTLFSDPAPSWHLRFDSTGRKLGTLFENSHPAWLEWIASPVLNLLPAIASSANNQILNFSADGRWLSSLSMEGPILWDVARRQKAAIVDVPNPLYATFDPKGENLWVNTAASSMRVNLSNRAPIKMTSGSGFWGIASSTSLIAVGDHKGNSIQLLDHEGHLIRKLGPVILPACPRLSPDGRWLACAAGLDVYIWEIAALDRPPRRVPGEEPDPRFSPDGQWLLSLGRMPRLWRTGTWEEGPALPLASDASSVSLACFSPDGHWLAVTQQNREIHLIDFATRQTLAIFEGPGESRIVAIEFSPDGKILAAARDRGEVQLWEIPSLRSELAKLKLDWQ